VDGALAAVRRLGVGIDLVGPTALVERELAGHPDARSLDVRVVEAPEVVAMDEAPSASLRRKPHASIRVATDLVAQREAAGVVSAGNTGATVMAAHASFGLLPGVDRPALATTIPTRRDRAILLDSGANVGCRPSHLVHFAAMGALYARVAIGIARPRVGLLSIGEEETKGPDLVREAHRLLKAGQLNFVGNVEARDVFAGTVDVIVCDGFTGNVTLKVSEGLVDTVDSLLREELRRSLVGRVGFLLARGAFARFQRRVDYAEYGGAPLLGVAGISVVGHGRSSAKAVENAVGIAVRCAREDLVGRLGHEMRSAAAV
jgi:glycerol-3-phosphate acyltransferase PlsX